MHSKLHLLLLFILLSPGLTAAELPVTDPAAAGFDPDRFARVAAVGEDYVDEGKLAGTVTLVSRGGKVVLTQAAGHKDLAKASPMTTDTIFRIYSMSKPITTVAALLLYEEGKLRLTDPVSRYIPELAEMKVLVGSEQGEVRLVDSLRPIQVRDLMTHTAGFTYGGFSNYYVDGLYREVQAALNSRTDLEGMVEALSKQPLLFQPGTRWHYSVSVDVLGYLIEVISGETLDEFFQHRIFEPLEMVDTGFYVPADKQGRFATCYAPLQGEEEGEKRAREGYDLKVVDLPDTGRFSQPPKFLSGGGGLVSTAADYARFLQMLLNGGELEGRRLLAPKTVGLMTQNHLSEKISLGGTNAFGFGLGFSILMDVAASGVAGSEGEYGWGGYASTLFWSDPGEDLLVVFMTQLIPSSTYPLKDDLKVAVYQALLD